MTTLSQKYANDVYKRVCEFKDNPNKKEYGSMAHKLPVLVRQAGLMQALTFVDTRGKDAQKKLLSDLALTLEKNNAQALLSECRSAELANYMWLTRQTLAALEWYKRFAESVLDVRPGEEEGQNDTTKP